MLFVDAASATASYYHIPDPAVNREDDVPGIDAREEAVKAQQKLEQDRASRLRAANERAEKARLRHLEACQKERLKHVRETSLRSL